MSKRPRYRALWLLLCLLLLCIGLVVVLGLLSGSGYVLLVWLGWQIQTSATVFALLCIVMAILIKYSLQSINWLIDKWQFAHPKNIVHYQQLLPYEQLGCLWLLDAKTSQQSAIEQIFDQSIQLRGLVKAHLLRENQQLEQAAICLTQGSALADLLAIEQIALDIAQQKNLEARNGLLALTQKPLSPFAQSLNPAWDQTIQSLWAQLLIRQPWWFLEAQALPTLTAEQHYQWLGAITQQLPNASIAQQHRLIIDYHAKRHQLEFWQHIASARQWLLILYQISLQQISLQQIIMPYSNDQVGGVHSDGLDSSDSNNYFDNLISDCQQLADQLLQQQFDPQVLSIWMHSQLQQDNPESQHFSQRLNELSQRYPGQPSIALAQWHQLNTQRQASDKQNSEQQDSDQLSPEQQSQTAEQILNNWPQHPDFAYLRLQQALMDQPDLLADLHVLYQANNSVQTTPQHNAFSNSTDSTST